MKQLLFSDAQDGDVQAIIGLWQACGLTRPWNDPDNDIAFARSGPSSTVLVGRMSKAGPVLSSVMVGHDGHRGWVYYLAVSPDYQGQGLGQQTMAAAESWHRSQGIWKVQLMVRTGNEAVRQFYERLDYGHAGCIVMERWIDPSKRGDR